MERESNPMQPMCRSGCGFYGNPATDGLCSVCYKDSLRKKQQPPVGSTPVSVPSPQPSPTFSPAITIPSAAQPTVQSLQQQHSEIKEIVSKLYDQIMATDPRDKPTTSNELTTSNLTATDINAEATQNQVDQRLKAAFASSTSSPKRFRFIKKRSAGGGLSQEIPDTFYDTAKHSSLSLVNEEKIRAEKPSSNSPYFRLNKLRRVGFLKETTDATKPVTAFENSFPSEKQESIIKFKPLKPLPVQATRFSRSILKPIGRRDSKSTIAVKAAKILTTPQKGQVATNRISLTAIRDKIRNDTKELRRKQDIKYRTTQNITVTANDVKNAERTSNEDAASEELTRNKSTTDLNNTKPVNKDKVSARAETDKYNLVGKLAFKAKLAEKQKVGLNNSNIITDQNKQPPKLTDKTQQNEEHELEISTNSKVGAKSILPKPLIFSTKHNLLKSGKSSQIVPHKISTTPRLAQAKISSTRRSAQTKISKNISNCDLSPKQKGTKIRPPPSSIRKNPLQLPLTAVTPITVPTKLIPKFTTNLNTYNLHTKKNHKDLTYNVTPSPSFLQQTQQKVQLRYVNMEKKEDSQSDQDTNDKKPRSASTSRKRKINEENTAKTSSDAAASASAGPSTSTQPAEEDDKDKEDDKDAKKKKNRCTECRKKVGLTGFLCRCGGLYCAVHRYSDKHNCTFDYREHGAQEIRRNNPVVVGEKIQKI